MQQILLSLATFVSTLSGGLLAVKLKDKINSVMGFTAGVLLGVVFFEIFPEIINQIRINDFPPINVMIALVVGFMVFHVLEKMVLIHHSHEHDYAEHHHPQVGVFSALALAGHSFMDGVGIGLGFQINPAVGLLVAIAVISHDFTDGMNTVALMVKNKNTIKKSIAFLLLDAIAPILGSASTLFFSFSNNFLVLYLGFFAGFLLYIGASDILPEAHSQKSSYKLIGLTMLGIALIFFISRLA
ncbi:MAG: ZIP family metal transporter [bacterium]